nr:MAG TPA: hypothetical protein [Crassvirales sp.]
MSKKKVSQGFMPIYLLSPSTILVMEVIYKYHKGRIYNSVG